MNHLNVKTKFQSEKKPQAPINAKKLLEKRLSEASSPIKFVLNSALNTKYVNFRTEQKSQVLSKRGSQLIIKPSSKGKVFSVNLAQIEKEKESQLKSPLLMAMQPSEIQNNSQMVLPKVKPSAINYQWENKGYVTNIAKIKEAIKQRDKAEAKPKEATDVSIDFNNLADASGTQIQAIKKFNQQKADDTIDLESENEEEKRKKEEKPNPETTLSIENNYFIIEFDPFYEPDIKRLGLLEKDIRHLNVELRHNQYSELEMQWHHREERNKAFINTIKSYAKIKEA